MSTEKNLLQRAKRWDQEALAEIYDRFSPALYRYSMRLLGDAALAEDCMAETFERFLKAVHKGGGPREHLQAYLYRIAHNWITDFYRRQPPPSNELHPNLKSKSNPAQSAIQDMESETLRFALLRLTPDQRQALSLKYLEDWPNKEISAAMNKSVGAVKALQHRALAALQKSLAEDLERTS